MHSSLLLLTLITFITYTSYVHAYATPTAVYTWNGGKYDESNGGPIAVKVPSWYSNIIIVSNNARQSTVVSRTASASQSISKLNLPISLQSGTPFTIAIWINWAGTVQPNQNQAVAVSTQGDSLKLTVSSAGDVTGTLAGASLPGGNIVAGTWYQYTFTYDGSKFGFYRDGFPVAGSPIATVNAFPGTSGINLLNSDSLVSGWVGAVDTVDIFTSTLDDQDVQFLWDDTRIKNTGQAPPQDKFVGHLSDSTVEFQNNIVSQPTGDITLSGTFIDVDFRATNQIWWKFYGVSGVTNQNGVDIDYLGTKGIATWDGASSILVFQPADDFVTVPRGTQWTFHIPASAFNLINPNSNQMGQPNDPRWQLAVFFLQLDQTPGRTKRQGLYYQGITNTPITVNPNPAR